MRYQAQYNQVYFDDVETVAPALSAGFVLRSAGTITAAPAEVIAGARSIKGSYSGTELVHYLPPNAVERSSRRRPIRPTV